MKKNATAILKRYQKANSIKTSWNTEYEKIFDYCMPSRNRWDKTSGSGEGSISPYFQDRRENLYSSIGEQSANDFVNTMQEVLAPPLSPWINLEAGVNFPESERAAVNKELDKIASRANEYKNNSSFDAAFSEFCYDLFAGTACMLVLPNTPRKPLTYKAIPLDEYAIEEGVNGEVRAVYRKYSMKRELLGAQWHELKKLEFTEEQGDKEMNIVESTYYDYDLEVWHYQVINSDENVELLAREYKTSPFIVLRWNKCAGEPYGRGPGLTALNDIKTLNLIKFYSLRNFAFQLPSFLVEEEMMLNADSFDPTPLTLNPVPNTDTSIKPLQLSSDFNAESYKTSELAQEIKKATYSSTLPNAGNEVRTATEIRQLLTEIRKSLNSVFGRLLSEFQIPLVTRTLDVLSDTDIFGEEFKERFDVNNIDGLKYKVNIITPIGKILRHSEAQAILSVATILMEIDPTGVVANKVLKVNELLEEYVKLEGIPDRFINSQEEIEQIEQQQAQGEQAAQQEAVNMDVLASNEKEMGKAVAKEAASGI